MVGNESNNNNNAHTKPQSQLQSQSQSQPPSQSPGPETEYCSLCGLHGHKQANCDVQPQLQSELQSQLQSQPQIPSQIPQGPPSRQNNTYRPMRGAVGINATNTVDETRARENNNSKDNNNNGNMVTGFINGIKNGIRGNGNS